MVGLNSSPISKQKASLDSNMSLLSATFYGGCGGTQEWQGLAAEQMLVVK